MHQFLRAIGFSDITKKQLNEVINNIIDKPEKLKVTKDSEGNEFAELSCDVAPNMGITVRGIYNDDDSFDNVECVFADTDFGRCAGVFSKTYGAGGHRANN